MEATDTPMDAAAVRRALYAAHLRPNRALGQNFCTDGARLAAMADAAAADGLPVLEIGPGLGALTEPLLLRAPRGENGFGYDPYFYYPPAGRTFAELTGEAKNAVSHRRRALESLRALLAQERRQRGA